MNTNNQEIEMFKITSPGRRSMYLINLHLSLLSLLSTALRRHYFIIGDY